MEGSERFFFTGVDVDVEERPGESESAALLRGKRQAAEQFRALGIETKGPIYTAEGIAAAGMRMLTIRKPRWMPLRVWRPIVRRRLGP